jgi:hypothetical protein
MKLRRQVSDPKQIKIRKRVATAASESNKKWYFSLRNNKRTTDPLRLPPSLPHF